MPYVVSLAGQPLYFFKVELDQKRRDQPVFVRDWADATTFGSVEVALEYVDKVATDGGPRVVVIFCEDHPRANPYVNSS